MDLPRLLIAEDDPHFRDVLVEALAELPAIVDTVGDGLTLVKRLAEPVDLLITDLRMPGCTGLEALKFADRPGLKAVILTAFPSSELRAAALQYPVVEKPCDLDQLRELVRSLLPSGVKS